MEKMMMKPKPPNNSANSANSKLAMHKDSHAISKLKPKIRIIHVFAPEIIKTDAANFRQLVQSLTGKGASAAEAKEKGFQSTDDQPTRRDRTAEEKRDDDDGRFPVVIKEEVDQDHDHLWQGGDDHDEQIINISNRSTSFLDGYPDFDGFIDEISEFRSLPFRSCSRMDHHVFHEDPKI